MSHCATIRSILCHVILVMAPIAAAAALGLMALGFGTSPATAATNGESVTAIDPASRPVVGGIDAGSTSVHGQAPTASVGNEPHTAGSADRTRLSGLGRCGILDVLCDAALPITSLSGIPGLSGLSSALDLGSNVPGLGGISNPFDALGDVIANATADAWTAAMLAIWHAGLFILRVVLAFAELFLTPDLSPDGPGRDVYAFSLWIALALVVIMTMIQLGTAAFKREGKSLARALIGAGQFVVVCSGWFTYCGIVLTACAAMTKALMKALLGVNTWSGWDPMKELDTQTITDGVVATVLGFLGMVLWVAAIAHILVYLARAAALLILAATGPITAAGLVSDAGRSWFWKSLRWFHVSALTPVLMVLVVGIGAQFSTGAAAHLSDSSAKSIGTALPAVMLICVSAAAPLALFKLLAFVDPGSPSGASFRQSMALQGGLQGLLSGSSNNTAGSTSAASTDAHGRSTGEKGAEESTSNRFNSTALGGAAQGALGKLGPAGAGLATSLGALSSLGAKATSLVADETNQSGVGHHTYGPDFSSTRTAPGNSITRRPHGHDDSGDPGDLSGDGDKDAGSGGGGVPPTPPVPTPPTLPVGNPGHDPEHRPEYGQDPQSSTSGGPKLPTPGSGAAGGAAAAVSVPPVPA